MASPSMISLATADLSIWKRWFIVLVTQNYGAPYGVSLSAGKGDISGKRIITWTWDAMAGVGSMRKGLAILPAPPDSRTQAPRASGRAVGMAAPRNRVTMKKRQGGPLSRPVLTGEAFAGQEPVARTIKASHPLSKTRLRLA